MTDQPQNTRIPLSPEEELDVLEAVYTIGKEKGLELLRPEQVRKLMEAGRVKQNDHKITSSIAENVTKQLMVRLGDSISLEERLQKFEEMYGAQPADFFINLEDHLYQVGNNA